MTAQPSQIGELLVTQLASGDLAWAADGACADSPYDPFDAAEADAIAILCGGCTVRAQCEAYRVEKEVTTGVWGGVDLSEEGVRR